MLSQMGKVFVLQSLHTFALPSQRRSTLIASGDHLFLQNTYAASPGSPIHLVLNL